MSSLLLWVESLRFDSWVGLLSLIFGVVGTGLGIYQFINSISIRRKILLYRAFEALTSAKTSIYKLTGSVMLKKQQNEAISIVGEVFDRCLSFLPTSGRDAVIRESIGNAQQLLAKFRASGILGGSSSAEILSMQLEVQSALTNIHDRLKGDSL